MSTPCIACIGIIGKNDNPLHIALFPPYTTPPPPATPTIPVSSNQSSPKPNPTPQSQQQPPPSSPPTTNAASSATLIEFTFLLNTTLDIFDARARDRSRIDQDLGLLQHIDERLSVWGHLTATGVKFAVVVDAWGKDGRGGVTMLERSGTGDSTLSLGGGRKGGKVPVVVQAQDLKVAFKALQTAWIRLVGNPFFVLDDVSKKGGKGGGGVVTSKRFEGEVRRIGEGWRPGLTVL